MNAYELADELETRIATKGFEITKQAVNMLRQQADRIAELEKVSSKPVAWWTGKFDDECEDFMFPDTRQAHIDHPQSETHNFFPIPLYTHPHRELSDEQIMKPHEKLGVAIADAGYAWTPEMRSSWEELDKQKELSDEEIERIAIKTIGNVGSCGWENIFKFAKAIIKASRGEK